MRQAKSVLLAGPDDLLRTSLADQLSSQGFHVIETVTGAQVLAYFDTGEADGVLLDANLADPPLVSVCRSLREQGRALPIFILGGDAVLAAAAAEAGATECFAKPFRLPLLMQRLAALLKDRDVEAVRLGDFLFDAVARTIEDGDGRRVPLTEKEVAILSYLRHAEGGAVSREELLAEVWGYADGATSHTVETHIYRLRRKLGNDANALLLTDTGGYRLATGKPVRGRLS